MAPPLFRFLLVAASMMLAVAGSEQQAAAADDGPGYDPSMCRKSFRCGDRLDIHYPFYLSNESKVIDGVACSYCGYPGMAVICKNRTATLQLGGGNNYTVLGIDYANHTVTLADADALAAGGGGGCPSVRHNVTIPRGAWLNFSATGNDSISFFYGCAFTAAAPPPPELTPINCSGVEQVPAPTSSFLAPTPDVQAGDWFRACNTVYVAPVLKEWLLSQEYYGRLGSGGYGEVLKRGFQLTWDPSAGPCYACEQSKGQCGYDQHGRFMGCLCSDRRVRGEVCDAATRQQRFGDPRPRARGGVDVPPVTVGGRCVNVRGSSSPHRFQFGPSPACHKTKFDSIYG